MEGAREGEGWLRSHPLAEAGLPVRTRASTAQHSIAQHKSMDLGSWDIATQPGEGDLGRERDREVHGCIMWHGTLDLPWRVVVGVGTSLVGAGNECSAMHQQLSARGQQC